MAKKTKKQVITWEHNQRQGYKKGDLSVSQIRDIENLPGWWWGIDNEAESNKTTHEVCNFIDKYGRKPSKYAKNKKEQELGIFIQSRRTAKQGKGRGKFYPSDQKIAEERGCSDLFEMVDFELESNKKTHEVCDFIDEHGIEPSQGAKGKKERELATYVQNKRKSKQGKGSCVFYSSDQKIVEERGHPDLFEIINRELENNKTTHEVCDFIDKHEREPSQHAKNKEERKLGQYVSTKRAAKQGKGTSKFYLLDQKIIEERGHPDLFTTGKRSKQLVH